MEVKYTNVIIVIALFIADESFGNNTNFHYRPQERIYTRYNLHTRQILVNTNYNATRTI